MTELSRPNFDPQDIVELQRIRALGAALQKMIADLDATEQNNDYNEQFNKMRFEVTAILRRYGFDLNVPRAITTNVLAERNQKFTVRLSGIVILGVMIVLVGLGVNSIILEDLLINSFGCLVSSLGMLLVIGSFVVWGLTSTRQQLSNLGDLYIRCETFLQQLDQILNTAIPDYANRPAAVGAPNLPSAVTLALDSLEKQAVDWQQKLETLKQQRLMLGPNEPPELAPQHEGRKRAGEPERCEQHDLRRR